MPQAIAEFFNSPDWGGITDVRDQTGNPVEHFTATGSESTDWSTPAAVPEPVTLTGLMMIPLCVRRRIAF